MLVYSMAVHPNTILVARLIHTGVYADGRPNTASVFVPDGDWGLSQQHRKTPLYVPAGGFIDVALTSDTVYSTLQGAISGFVTAGILRVELILRLRDPADLGGSLGTGVSLAPGLNAERAGNVLRFVVLASDVAGFIVDEAMTVAGLTGPFSVANGNYTISEVTKGADLAGANPLTWVIGVPNVGPNGGPVALVGATLTLPAGKVRFEARGSGNAGGLGPNAAVYVGGDLNVTGIMDPTALQVTPMLAADVPLGSYFVDSLTGQPSFKDANGIVTSLVGGGGGGGGGNIFTYRPGGASIPSANVYDTWAAAHAAAAAWPVPCRLHVDSSLVSPAPLPAGIWDMSGITLAGAVGSLAVDPFSKLQAQDGAVLTNLFFMTDLISLGTVSTSPVIETVGYQTLLMDLGAEIHVDPGGVPLFRIPDASSLNVIMLTGASLQYQAAPIFEVEPDGGITIQLYENCNISQDLFIGSSATSPYILVGNAAASYNDFFPSWLGSPVQFYLAVQGVNVAYQASGQFGLPDNVGSALDALALRSGTNGWVYRPGGPVEGPFFADFNALINALANVPGPKDLYFDDEFSPIDLNVTGTYDMKDVVWHGKSSIGNAETVVSISNDTSFMSVAGFKGRLRIIVNNNIAPGFQYLNNSVEVVMSENSMIESVNGGVGIFSNSATAWWLKSGSKFRFATTPVFDLDIAGGVTFYLEDGSAIEGGTLAGTVGPYLDIVQLSPSASYTPIQPNLMGTVSFSYGFPLGGLTTISALQNVNYNANFYETVRVDTTAPDFNVFLPLALGNPGKFVEVKNAVIGGGVVTVVATGGETIDGSPSEPLVGFLRVRSDGSNWMVVS